MSGARTTPMEHEEAIGLLDAWRDGELDADEGARVRDHVAGCARCESVEAALGGGLRAALIKPEITAISAEPDLLPAVQRKIRMRSRGRFYGDRDEATPRRAPPSPWPLLLASLAVLGALATAYLLLGQTAEAQRDGAPTMSAPAR